MDDPHAEHVPRDDRPQPAGGDDGDGGDVGDVADGGDRLLELRAALDTVEELPLEERAAVFERTHAIVTDELRALELG